MRDIDLSSLRLEGIPPLHSSLEDVGTPARDDQDTCNCTTDGPDGFDDLVLKFKTQDLVGALSPVSDGDEIQVGLTGTLLDGTDIEGQDCIIIRAKGRKGHFRLVVRPQSALPGSWPEG